MGFKTQKNKFSNLNKTSNSVNIITQRINIQNLFNKSNTTQRKIYNIELYSGLIEQNTTHRYDYIFKTTLENLILLSNIIPIFYTEEGWNFEDLNFSPNIKHIWRNINDNTYKLTISNYSSLETSNGKEVPLYLDLNLYIVRKRMSYGFQNYYK